MTELHELIDAAIHDDVDAIRSADPKSVNSVDDADKTPLFYALYRSGATNEDDPRTVRALLELGADPNQAVSRRDGPRSPLHQAAIRSMSSVCEVLVEAGAEPAEPGLIHAAAEGAVCWLVERCLTMVPPNVVFRGATPLHEGCYSGSEAVVRSLLAVGANPHALVEGGDWAGFDTLNFAIIGNAPTVVAMMLEAGVPASDAHVRYLLDPDRTWALPIEELEDARARLCRSDETPAAPGAPALEIADLLADAVGSNLAAAVARDIELREPEPELPTGSPSTPPEKLPVSVLGWRSWLHDAAIHGWSKQIAELPATVDVNLMSVGAAGDISRPPLHIAADRNDLGTARALLDAGADPKLRGADNRSSYRAARTREMRALLRAYGPVW